MTVNGEYGESGTGCHGSTVLSWQLPWGWGGGEENHKMAVSLAGVLKQHVTVQH